MTEWFVTDNSAPTISAPTSVNAGLGEMVEFFVTATDVEDDDADVTVELIFDVEGATLDSQTRRFTWTVTSAEAVEIA